MTDINAAISAAASGMRAQQTRMRIAAENIANANSTGVNPNEDPFRRRIPLMESTTLASGARGVRVEGAVNDMTDFREEYNPSHPAADDRGYVRLPNVDTLVEMMDMREATRAYEANLNMIEAARTMTSRALDLLRK
ncbi:MAG: flagellar basal body rod protein FlgC [Caulobacteraceae bacterium]|nr:flagellar basal body rod protein FlgC [Caulobacteraceae bacterium]MBP6688508.1 flagellar basal body rod protein FlgC [Hyphomonadaceae bacterium]